MKTLPLLALLLFARPASAAWTIHTIDPTMGSGISTSQQISSIFVDDFIGEPHVAYWAPGQGFRYFNGFAYESAQPSAPAMPDELALIMVGYASLAMGAGNEPWIAEVVLDANNNGQGALSVVHRAGGVWSSEPIGTATGSPSLGYDRTTGRFHLFYPGTGGAMYAYRDGSGWHSAPFGVSSAHGTLQTDRHGKPAIAYITYPERVLFYATLVNGSWQSEVVDDSGIASGPSLAFSGTNHPRIAYSDISGGPTTTTLRLAEEALGNWTTQAIPAAGNMAFEYSLAILGDAPYLAFHDSNVNQLWLAKRERGAWTAENVDPLVGAGQNPSLAFDGEYAPVIAYKSSFGTGTRYAIGSRVVGVEPVVVMPRLQLSASGASPVRRGASVALIAATTSGGRARLEAFDAAGRAVGPARWIDLAPGSNRVEWIAPARAGLTFLRLSLEGGGSAQARLVVL